MAAEYCLRGDSRENLLLNYYVYYYVIYYVIGDKMTPIKGQNDSY